MTKHVTTPGDTWDYLAYKYYGNELFMGVIISANSQLLKYEILPANISLLIPELPTNIKPIVKPIW